MACRVPQSSQPDYSTKATGNDVAGSIGIVRAKVSIWDHDPLIARPQQRLTFQMSEELRIQLPIDPPGVVFETGAAILQPQFPVQDMFIATKKLETSSAGAVSFTQPVLDFVGATQSGVGQLATKRLPGGDDYERNGDIVVGTIDGEPVFNPTPDPWIGRDIFPHQVWLHVGNLLKRGVVKHPSEYHLSISELIATQSVRLGVSSVAAAAANNNLACEERFNTWTLDEIQGAVQWEYTMAEANGRKGISPVQTTKPAEDSLAPAHWTLEKFMPVWQGQDFFVTITKGDKSVTSVEDPGPAFDCVDTNWGNYKYLMYKSPGNRPAGWTDGISNEAYYVKPKEPALVDGFLQSDYNAGTEAEEAARQLYWWRYNTYILIEIGAEHPQHNYFIELIKGNRPRFIHVGTEWDNPNRLTPVGDLDPADFRFMKKSRVLGEYDGVSCEELFKQDSIRVSVRNHLGNIVVTFEGYEGDPWVISRTDNDFVKFDFSKTAVPMVVPPGKLRIHGGNISCSLGYGPTTYVPVATIPFEDRQADTGGAENKDLYMTFSHMATGIKNANRSFKRRYFRDSRLGFGNVGYDCDAFQTKECLQNRYRDLEIYKAFNRQYRQWGKGWVNERTADTIVQLGGPGDDLLGEPHRLQSGVDPDRGGTPHTLEIVNIQSEDKIFPFGLDNDEDTAANYPYKDFASKWNVGVRLKAGSVIMPILTDEIVIDSAAQPKLFPNVVTPIATSWTLIVLGGGKPIQDNVDPIDVSELIVSINDSWSTEDFTTINHEMQMRAYIPLGVPTGGNPREQRQAERPDLHALGQQMLKLNDKTFYVTVSYWWDNGVGKRDAVGNKIRRGNKPPEESDLLIQMTGIAQGAELEKSVNKIFMDFTVKDYFTILEQQVIYNSPFFDSMNDVSAIYDLLSMAHFDPDRDRSSGIDRRPLGYLQKVLQDGDRIGNGVFRYNGEESRCRAFNLPGAYADITNPAVRFQNGETYASAIKKIAQYSTKVTYFDRWGVFRFENSPAIDAAFSSGKVEDFPPVFEFRTSPFDLKSSGGLDDEATSSERFTFDPQKHAAHLVYNVVSYTRSVEDCVNQIIIMTATNDHLLPSGKRVGGFIIEGYTFFEQIWDPNSEGFLGFRKPFFQSNGLFGGEEGVKNGILLYAKMKYPPASITFETYGVPGLKPLDIVSLDDNLFYITEISHEIDPSTNNWWMNVTGEWLKPFLGDLGFLEERGDTDSDASEAGEGG